MSGINDYIDSEVKNNDVVLFMKGTPGFPQCGFSGQVVQILDYIGVDYKGVNILTSDELRQGIKAIPTGRRFRSSTSRVNSSAAATSCARCSRLASSRPSSPKRASPPRLPDPPGPAWGLLESWSFGRCAGSPAHFHFSRTRSIMDQQIKAETPLGIPRWEFIALAAALMALNALAVDIMLPACSRSVPASASRARTTASSSYPPISGPSPSASLPSGRCRTVSAVARR